jgi:subtilisin family serine protease
MKHRRTAFFPLLGAVLGCGCAASEPAPERGSPGPSLAEWHAGRGIAPRSVVPVVKPLALDARPVRAVVELEGAPITAVQALEPDVKLTLTEREALRSVLLTRQAGVRRELETLGAQVLHGYQNAYNGVSVLAHRSELARIAKLPGVVAVHPLRPKKLSTTSAPEFVSAPAVWARGPKGLHGEAIKVAVVDTGIDYTHANFGGPGTPAAYARAHANEAGTPDPRFFGPHAARVKGGVDLVGDAYDADSDDPEIATPHPDSNPLDCEGHGSHVAGILGGSGVTLDGRTYRGSYDVDTLSHAFRIPPGTAPRVDLYAVRIFGCTGETLEDVDAIEWAVDHDMDVINLSLGTDLAGADEPAAVAAANAVKSGVVVVAAAGNAGAAPYVAGSPANGDGVLSVGALDAQESVPAAVLSGEGARLTALALNSANFADGTPFRVVPLGTPDALATGCNAADYDRPDVAGALVVMLRGDCYFDDRMALALEAGAGALALVNDTEGYPPSLGQTPDFPLPFFGVLAADAPALLQEGLVTVEHASLANPDFRALAEFSSSGPRMGDSALEPSLVAPGVDIVSTAVGSGSEGLELSGTSMASPVVAGLAALVRQAHPRWRALEVANVLANTAEPSLLGAYSARRAGTGVPVVTAAVKSSAVAEADGLAALNFGFVELPHALSLRRSVTLHNLANVPMRFDVTVPAASRQGFPHELELPASVQVPAHGSVAVGVRLTLAGSSSVDPLAFDELAGMLVFTPQAHANAGVTLRVPYYAVVRPEARLVAKATLPNARRASGLLTLTNHGSKVAGSAEVLAWGIDSPADATGCEDVRAAGVESLAYGDDRLLVFAVNGWRRCSSASENEYDLAVQLENGDVYLVAGIDAGLVQYGAVSGELATLVVNLASGEFTLMPAVAGSDSGVVYLTALASELGLSASAPRFSYAVQVSSLFDASAVDAPAGVATFNAFSPSLAGTGRSLSVDRNGTASVALGLHAKEWARTPAKGFMVVLAENAPGAPQTSLFELGHAN